MAPGSRLPPRTPARRAAAPDAAAPVTERKRPYAVVAIDPAAVAAGTGPEALRRTVDRLLSTSVRQVEQAREPVTRLRHVDLQQLAALEVSGRPMQLVNALSQPDAVFVYALVQGACRLATERGDAELRGGQFVVMRGDLCVRTTHLEPFLIRGMHFPAAQLDRELPGWRAAELQPVTAGESGPGELLLALQDRLLASGPHLTSRSADAYARTLACVLADALCGVLPSADVPQTRAEHHRRRIRAYVRTHLADPALDAGAVAAGVGLSVAHLHRLFAGEPQSLFAWIQGERLDACRAALGAEGGPPSIREVAFAWGFQDLSHFSRSFRRRYGHSPREWRARAAGGDDAGAPAVTPPE